MTIEIEKLREAVDETFVGVRLNTDKVKPVHIANGLFRTVLGEVNSTKRLHRFVFAQKATGEVPPGHEFESVMKDLLGSEAIEPSIASDQLAAFRRQLKRIVSADNGVFTGQMQSYSAGADAFLTADTVGQDAGEFVASWLRITKSPLLKQVQDCLRDKSDIISQMCRPLLTDELKPFVKTFAPFEGLQYYSQFVGRSKTVQWLGLERAAVTLANNLEEHPDKLFKLRMTVMFSAIVVMRHIALLESYFDKDKSFPPPFLLDFGLDGSLKDASKQSYSRCTQSIARFYSCAFGEILKKRYSIDDLMRCKAPRYKDGVKKKIDDQGDNVWKVKKEASKTAKNKFVCFGEAIFDILALQAEADPIRYFRGLGRRVGLLHPPSGAVVPWFRPKQDLVELILYCCVDRGSSIELPALCELAYERFGVVVGGGTGDENILKENGIYTWDHDSLLENASSFATSLVHHGFATQLADGVMKVSLEVKV